ncbi:MAG: DUF1285 domain-containing protein [Rhodospirillales bacterium]
MKKPSLNSGVLGPPGDVNIPGPARKSGPPGGPQLCGDLAMRIDRDGVWYYRGSPIARQELVKLFSSVLKRDESGEFWLITPAEKGTIEVEDAPFIGVELQAAGSGEDQVIEIRINTDDIVTIDADHPLEIDFAPGTGEPSPYITVRDGLKARLARPVYYELVELGTEGHDKQEGQFGIWSSGVFFSLGTLPEDE